MSYIAGIQEETIVDGLGIRFSVYWSGCSHHCKNCHNPETWSFNYGTPYKEKVDEIINRIRNDINVLDGVTLSGGDPLNKNNIQDVANFISKIRSEFPQLNIWCYTGYTFEDILHISENIEELKYILNNIDILVDGEYIESLRDLNLAFRGSSNQRLVDVKKSLELGKVVTLPE